MNAALSLSDHSPQPVQVRAVEMLTTIITSLLRRSLKNEEQKRPCKTIILA